MKSLNNKNNIKLCNNKNNRNTLNISKMQFVNVNKNMKVNMRLDILETKD